MLTPAGWKTHGDLQVGDHVFGRDGLPKQVLALSDKSETEYELTFSDGAVIQCHGNHEWLVVNRHSSHGKPRLYETRKIAESVTESGIPNKRRHRYFFQVDSPIPVEFPERVLLMHPYMLGVWLGDGTTTKNCVTYAPGDSAMIDKLANVGYKTTTHNIHTKTGVCTDYIRRLYGELVALGLIGMKRIPDDYIFTSKAQRIELLAGLIDTDGHVNKEGRVRIVTVSEKLANQIAFLVRSLGMNSYITFQEPSLSTSGIQGRLRVYTVGFNCDVDIPTALPRKKTNLVKQVKRKRAIVKIEKKNGSVGRCIQVEGGIYLVGKTLIPTHNSELISKWTPIWFLNNFPNKRVMLASYEAGFASSWGKKTRDEIVASAESLDIRVDQNSSASNAWNVADHDGGMITNGVGGAFTGRGGDLIIVDDPTRNRAEASSPILRDKTFEWYRSTLRSRLEPGGSIIIAMQRWSSDDLVARILRDARDNGDSGEKWKVINLPAYAYPNDPLGRKEGESLWPQRISREDYEKTRLSVGVNNWISQYQQRPEDVGGGIFKYEYWKGYLPSQLPRFKRVIQVWDTAYKKTSAADYTACVTMAESDNGFYVLDVFRQRLEFPELEKAIPLQFAKHRPNYVLIESEASGLSVIQTLRRNTTIPIDEVYPAADKVARANEITGYLAAGKVFIPDSAPWLVDFLEELTNFPDSPHDDMVDAFTYALRYLTAHQLKDPETHDLLNSKPSGQMNPLGLDLDDERYIDRE